MYTEASWLSTQLDQKEPNSTFQKKEHLCAPDPVPSLSQSCTSVGMLGTEPVKPFSAMALWELLGELGPEPGALLHTDDTTGEVAVTWACFEPPSSQTFTVRTGEEALPPGPVPVISTALFLKVLITVPSFRRRRGLLLLSATFCFSLERTFKLGSEAGETVAGVRLIYIPT